MKMHGKWISSSNESATMCGFVCQKRIYMIASTSVSTSVVVYHNDSEYLIQTEKDPGINFTSARQTCHRWGGDLTDIRNAQENRFIAGIFVKRNTLFIIME